MWPLPLGGSVWTVKYYWTSGRGETTGGTPFPRARSGVIWPSPRPESPKSNELLEKVFNQRILYWVTYYHYPCQCSCLNMCVYVFAHIFGYVYSTLFAYL